jgi:S1-C subfamily serine protease
MADEPASDHQTAPDERVGFGARLVDNPYDVVGHEWTMTFDVLRLAPKSDVGPEVRDVGNWTVFDSAILSVLVHDSGGGRTRDVGSAVLISPGLAITATHVIRDHLEDAFAGRAETVCFGALADGTAALWRVIGSTYADDNDITFLELRLASAPTSGGTIRAFPITTRTPIDGEMLFLIGFTATVVDWTDDGPAVTGRLLTSAGPMTALHYPYRDTVLAPFPAIEIACGSVGGMSGGAVVDDAGHLVGIVSTGMSHDDGRGPTLASWLLPSLGTNVVPNWLDPEVSRPIISITDRELLFVEGRDRVTMEPDGMRFDLWHQRDDSALRPW